jgi:hypothetical protein
MQPALVLIDIPQNGAKVATQWLHGLAKWLHSGYTETGQSMARPKKTDAPDLSEARELTAGLIERLTCRTDIKAQAFLRDSKAPGLRVRVTNTGSKVFRVRG